MLKTDETQAVNVAIPVGKHTLRRWFKKSSATYKVCNRENKPFCFCCVIRDWYLTFLFFCQFGHVIILCRKFIFSAIHLIIKYFPLLISIETYCFACLFGNNVQIPRKMLFTYTPPAKEQTEIATTTVCRVYWFGVFWLNLSSTEW